MAKEYKDQILDTSVNTKRVYNIVDSDGNIVAENISLEDKTVYSQEGTEFGAQEVNEIYEAIEEVNQSLNDNLNVRYNAEKDKIQILFDGKWVDWKIVGFSEPIELIPIMASGTSDVVTISASSIASSGFDAYMAFDGNEQTYWSSSQNNTSGQYLTCKFTNPVCVKKAFLSRNYIGAGSTVWKLQASNDGNVWKDLTSDKTISVDYGKTLTVNFENDELYTYYRLYCVSSTSSWANLTTLQLYGKYA